MIFPAIVNHTHNRCHPTSSTDKKLNFRRLDKKCRPTPCLKRRQTRQSEQQFESEYLATNAAEYYSES